MKPGLLPVIFIFIVISAAAQDDGGDWGWWNELHGWQVGDPGWRNWIIIAPGAMGPNALPVPEVKKGIISKNTEIELTASSHFHPGDPTQDISGKLYIPFAKEKVAVEFYGVMAEHFSFSDKIRNERFARDKDGEGFAVGDLYLSTLIQIVKDRKFPNTMLRFATKTASGNQLEAARFTDSPAYFFDLSFSKTTGSLVEGMLRPFLMAGFYTWQTNDELNLQNDAFLYALGTDYLKRDWLFSVSVSGYSGYKEYDKPVKLNLDFRKELGYKTAIRVQYQHGFRDWEYHTIRFSFLWKLNRMG